MGNITDSARRGFAKRSNPLTGGNVPEWWSLASWVGLGAVILVVAASAVLDHRHHVTPAAGPRPYAVQTVGADPAPQSLPSGDTVPSADGSPDFGAQQPAQVPLTGGAGVTTVPAGALSAAQAGLAARASGDWSGVPLTATSKIPEPTHGAPLRLTGPVTVLDPAVTGGTYLFSAPAGKPGAPGPSVQLQVSVEATSSGFAVFTS